MILLLGVFLLSFISATGIFYEIDTEANITVVCLNEGYCSSSSYCNINIEDPEGNLIVVNQNMTNQISFHNYTINLTAIGDYGVSGFCADGIWTKQIDFSFGVNYLGEEPPTGFDGRFILLLFFVSLVVMLIYFQRQVNFDRWYGSILNKYENRNFFRTFISGMGHFFMKNPFSLFYMIGLFIMLLIYDITRAYVLTSAYSLIRVLVGIYLFGLLFMVLEIFGDIQEFFAKIMDDFKKLGWGLSDG
ncbi:hypothetical protein KAT51_00905 [bacterium]|nr:hypothetical protein [bacterium]